MACEGDEYVTKSLLTTNVICSLDIHFYLFYGEYVALSETALLLRWPKLSLLQLSFEELPSDVLVIRKGERPNYFP